MHTSFISLRWLPVGRTTGTVHTNPINYTLYVASHKTRFIAPVTGGRHGIQRVNDNNSLRGVLLGLTKRLINFGQLICVRKDREIREV